MAMRPAVLLLASVALAGCTSSARFGGYSTAMAPSAPAGPIDRPMTARPAPDLPAGRPGAPDDDVIPGGQAPSTDGVTREEIAPPSVSGSSDVGPSAIDPALRPSEPSAQPRIMTEEPPPPGQAPPPPPAVVAAQPRPERSQGAPPSPTALTGTWTVTDAGDRCRITLTSQPLFEFYRASPQNCRAPSLARINAWEQRGSEVVLLQPGGRVAARLFPQGSSYSGATATGATVTMAR